MIPKAVKSALMHAVQIHSSFPACSVLMCASSLLNLMFSWDFLLGFKIQCSLVWSCGWAIPSFVHRNGSFWVDSETPPPHSLWYPSQSGNDIFNTPSRCFWASTKRNTEWGSDKEPSCSNFSYKLFWASNSKGRGCLKRREAGMCIKRCFWYRSWFRSWSLTS